MRHAIPGAGVLLLIAGFAPAQTSPGPPETSAGKPLFAFRSTLWVNLHHFLYVLGRARNDTRDSHRAAVANAPADTQGFETLSATERGIWERAIACYQKNVSPMDAVFDRYLIAMTNALAAAGDRASLAGVKIPADTRTVLEDAAPVYRKVWWERHSRSNCARTEELQALLTRYGRPISGMLTKAYQQDWPPEGLTVQMCAYANWAGAYSISGRLIVMASTDDGIAASEGLETVFHEAMHQWDDAMIPRLQDAARRLHADIPRTCFTPSSSTPPVTPPRVWFPATAPMPIRSGRAACRGVRNSTSTGCHICAVKGRWPARPTGWLAHSQNSLNVCARRSVIPNRNGAGRNCAAHDGLAAGEHRRPGCLRADHVAMRTPRAARRAAPAE